MTDLVQLDRATPKKIAVVGDPMLDIYVDGTLRACQDGCPKFVAGESIVRPGGAAGARAQLERWHARARLVYPKAFHTDAWPVKTRYIDAATGRVVFREDRERVNYGLTRGELTTARDATLKALRESHPDAVLVADYGKGLVDATLAHALILFCRDRGVPCVADPRLPPGYWIGAVLKCNGEYALAHGLLQHDPAAVVTYGPHPPIVQDDQGSDVAPVHDTTAPCVNHVGAGDCFAAVLTLALAHGLPLREAAAWAHAAGKVYVRHPHGRQPWPHEVRRELDLAGGKVLGEEGLVALRQSNPGRVVVFTNGCFDLLGPHHLYLLQQAKALGDVLIVAINGDESVRRLKGPGRPVIPLAQRVAMLAGVEAVDWVVSFDSDTPAALIEMLRPDMRIKGNFPDLNRAGDEFAGKIVLIEPMSGWSTTETVRKMSGSGP